MPPEATATDNSDSLLTTTEEQTPNDTSTDAVVSDDAATDDTGADDTDGSDNTDEVTFTDFSLPEGMTMDEALLAEVTPLFKEVGLTQEQAQKFIDIQAKQNAGAEQNSIDAFNSQMQTWKDESKNDTEFGGDKFNESLVSAKSALDKFGTPKLTELLNNQGLGNHPEVIRLLTKVGRLTQEDVPGNEQHKASPEKDRVAILYPSN